MNSRERVFQAINHKEADRVPVDFAATHVTGIHKIAYNDIAKKAGMPEVEEYSFLRSGLVEPAEEMLREVGSDVRGVWPNKLGEKYWAVESHEDEDNYYITDEWGAKWKKEKKDGLYYSVYDCPLTEEELEWDELEAYEYPVLDNDEKFAGMKEKADKISEKDYAIFVENPMVEILHSQTRVRGYENFFTDLLIEPEMASYMMAKTEERMEDYFKRVAQEVNHPMIVRMSDDLGSQSSLLISPDTYRTYVKPLHKKLIESIRKTAKNDVKIFFHCDGAIKELIPDLIEIGADIINPIQYSCADMDPLTLKKEFGKDVCFWGCGIDTQTTFRTGTVEEIKDTVKRQLDILMPGGGFVFSQIHNFQKGTDPEKFWAVWNTVKEYGKY